MIDRGFKKEETGDSICVRGHSISFEVYGPDVLHNNHPVVEIAVKNSEPTIVWADTYDDLIAAVDKLRAAIVERSTRP